MGNLSSRQSFAHNVPDLLEVDLNSQIYFCKIITKIFLSLFNLQIVIKNNGISISLHTVELISFYIDTFRWLNSKSF